eukprot:3948664-Pyramimonas_sp.AAC.1
MAVQRADRGASRSLLMHAWLCGDDSCANDSLKVQLTGVRERACECTPDCAELTGLQKEAFGCVRRCSELKGV